MGTQQTPPNQVLIAIALFLSMFIMGRPYLQVYEKAADPYLNGDVSAEIALEDASNMKGFLVKNTRKDDLKMFADMAEEGAFEAPRDVPLTILLPAFITSELKTAFQIGFYYSYPFW